MIEQGRISITWNSEDFKSFHFERITYGNQVAMLSADDFDFYNIAMDYTKDTNIPEILGVKKEFSYLNDKSYAIHKIKPGHVLPFHSDHYVRYKQIFGIESADDIKRIIVFLEDWYRGQLLEIEDEVVANWKAGDWVMWTGESIHMAANLGHNDRYTLQITGHVR